MFRIRFEDSDIVRERFLESKVSKGSERDLVRNEWVEGLRGRWPFSFQKFSIYRPYVCCAFINCCDKKKLT